MTPARLLPAALLLVALLPIGPAAGQEGEDLPRIFLEKKVFSDTAGGKQSFYETHTVEAGDTLWKILERKEPLTPDRYAERLKDFRRVNPKVADPSRLAPGQKILVPAAGGEEPKDDGRTVRYKVKRGDSLLKIFSSRGVPRRQRKRYLDAVREINPSVTDVNRILAGKTLRLPTEGYFTEAKPPKVPEPEKIVPPEAGIAAVPPPVEATRAPEVPPAPALTRDIPPGPGQDALAAGKPEAELLVPKPSPRPRRSLRRGRQSPRRRSSSRRGGLRTGGSCRTSSWRSAKSGSIGERCTFPSLPGATRCCSCPISPSCDSPGGRRRSSISAAASRPGSRTRSQRNGNRSGSSLSPTRAARGIGSTGSCACRGTIP